LKTYLRTVINYLKIDMLTFTNFTITVPFADFSAENWEALVRDSTNPSWDEVEMLMLRNAHRGTTHTLKNYVDQVLNGAINHYNCKGDWGTRLQENPQ